MNVYIKDNCFVEVENAYDSTLVSDNIADQATKYVTLTEAQATFREANPTATATEVLALKMNE